MKRKPAPNPPWYDWVSATPHEVFLRQLDYDFNQALAFRLHNTICPWIKLASREPWPVNLGESKHLI